MKSLRKIRPNNIEIQKGNNSPIKHVDQSIDHREHESHATVVRQSYRESNEVVSPDTIQQSRDLIAEGNKIITFERNQNRSFQEIVQKKIKYDGGVQHSGERRNEAGVNLIISHRNKQKADFTIKGDMLNVIAKKAQNEGRTKNQSPERSATQRSDILEQLNSMSQLGPYGNQHNGYHQLEPKLFPTDTKALDRARMNKSGMQQSDKSLTMDDKMHSGHGHINSIDSVSKKLQSKKVSANIAKSEISSLYTKS